MTGVYFCRSSQHRPFVNLAIEQVLLELFEDFSTPPRSRQLVGPNDEILFLWQNHRTVVVGRNQDAHLECNIPLLESEGGTLARRISGGGAVYHDTGNLNYSFLCHRRHFDLQRQLQQVIAALQHLGVSPTLSGRNDILLEGKKCSGHAFYLRNDAALHHGSILVATDLDAVQRYLTPSVRKLAAKGISSVRSRVTNLCDTEVLLDRKITVTQLISQVESAMTTVCQGSFLSLTELDETKVEHHRQKMASWEWRFGSEPTYDVMMETRFDWGDVRLEFSLQKGIIRRCQVFSDAMFCDIFSVIESCLVGQRFDDTELAMRLLSKDCPSFSSTEQQAVRDIGGYLAKFP